MSTVDLRQPASILGLATQASKWAEEALKQAAETRRLRAEYRRAVDELQGLSDRTLSDLGIHRSDIRGRVREAIYGEQ